MSSTFSQLEFRNQRAHANIPSSSHKREHESGTRAGTPMFLQRAAHSSPSAAPSGVRAVLSEPGVPLTRAARDFFESRFQKDLGDVRIHTDASASESARQVNALAYTVGQHIVLRAGQYAPETQAGRRLLAHELAHVTQQSAHQNTTGILGMDTGAGDPLEQLAEQQAEQVVSGKPVGHSAIASAAHAILQRYRVPGELPCSEVVDWLNANSPYAPEWAETRCTYSFNGSLQTRSTTNPDGTVTVRVRGHDKLSVSVDCPVDRPEWNPSRRANRDAEVTAWNNMRATLDAHEAEHRRIGRTWRATLEARFKAVDFSVTGTDQADAQQQAVARAQSDQQTWMADAQAAQSAIDPFRGANLACP